MKNTLRRILILGLLGALAACDLLSARNDIDAAWHRSAMVDGHLSFWLAKAPTPSGLFATAFDRRWQPKAGSSAGLTAQSRLVYAMAIVYEVTKDKRYLEAATKGGDFMLSHFRDPVFGGFFARVADDGKVLSDAKQSYGHAFALFALAHLARVSGEVRFRDAALEAWQEINQNLRDRYGGFPVETPRNFVHAKAGAKSQNPVMHMFEALLALVDATADPDALAGATSVGNLVVYRLLQGSADGSASIPEWYDEKWQPLPTKEAGGFTDLGHQFEWSHMLLTSTRRGLPAMFAAASERVLQYAITHGYDENTGGAFSKRYPDGSVVRDKGWWQQAECLRALQEAAAAHGRSDLWRRYGQTLDFIQEEFIDKANGGWHTGPARECKKGACADEQPDPYHMVGMHMSAIKRSSGGKP